MERLALDTRNWLPKEDELIGEAIERTVEDFAAASIEQRESPPEERINTGVLYLNEDGHLYDTLGNKVKLRWDTKSDYLENHGFLIIERWAREKQSKNLAWISPPSSEFGYSEARLMVYETKGDNGNTEVLYRAFCLPYSESECANLAKEIASTSDKNFAEVGSSNKLRASPVFFNPPESLTWFEYLEGLIDEPKIWEKVRGADDIRAKEEMKRLAKPVVEKYYNLILAAERAYDYMTAGAMMEAELAASGILLQASGSCGISNQEALKSLQDANLGIFDKTFAQAIISSESGKHVMSCGSCGTPINSVISAGYRCHSCGGTYEGC